MALARHADQVQVGRFHTHEYMHARFINLKRCMHLKRYIYLWGESYLWGGLEHNWTGLDVTLTSKYLQCKYLLNTRTYLVYFLFRSKLRIRKAKPQSKEGNGN